MMIVTPEILLGVSVLSLLVGIIIGAHLGARL